VLHQQPGLMKYASDRRSLKDQSNWPARRAEDVLLQQQGCGGMPVTEVH
jgi:hypothetical protein